MDYLYGKVEMAHFNLNTPERRAFRKHLDLVAKALHGIEWVDSCDRSPGDENDAIRDCLSDSAILEQLVTDAQQIQMALQEELDRVTKTR